MTTISPFRPAMIPAGYMAKKVAPRPDWLGVAQIEDIYSVSGCISQYFADYVSYWKHNGYWLFNSVEAIRSIAIARSIDISACQFFYYELFELQWNEESKEWQPFESDKAFETAVLVTVEKQPEGYDVVTFQARTSPECSPLSCNGLAQTTLTNRHCLLNSFEEARQEVESGTFDKSEPGPFRIFAVYTLKTTL